MRRLIFIIALQVYAFILAGWQTYLGVRTDEAKYLLDIPYPHPPLARWILSLIDGWQYQEIFWRVVLATLMVQAVWLVIDMAKKLPVLSRISLAIGWLFSASVIYAAGTVMMAPLTALQMLVFVRLYCKNKDDATHVWLIGLLWLASLFTAYQAVLFGPLILALLWRSSISKFQALTICAIPVLLLALYTLTNPLAAASMFIHADKDVSQSLFERIAETGWVWALGGSMVLSVLGTIGLLRRPKFGLLMSFVLVSAYVFLSRYDYYAILFTPLFIAGFIHVLKSRPTLRTVVILGVPVFTFILMFNLRPPQFAPSLVPSVMRAIDEQAGPGTELLIKGSFGHEWQHASDIPVSRFTAYGLNYARAVVCLQPCKELEQQAGWEPIAGLPMEVWVKR